MKRVINTGYVLLICFSANSFAQAYEEPQNKLISIGFGAGGFFAGKYVANYYNGNDYNENKISYVLGQDYWRDEIIRDELDGRQIEYYECPSNMRYKIATAVNFRAMMRLSDRTSVFLQMHQVNLLATDIFTMAIESAALVSEPNIMMCSIWGKESRSMIDVGFRRLSDTDPEANLKCFFELAFNVTNTKVREHKIQIGNFAESIIDRGVYTPNLPLNEEFPESANGIGISGTVGFQYDIHRNAFLDAGISGYLQDINLTGYKNFHLNFNLFIRLNILMF